MVRYIVINKKTKAAIASFLIFQCLNQIFHIAQSANTRWCNKQIIAGSVHLIREDTHRT